MNSGNSSSSPLDPLCKQFEKLPGVGPKSAQRLAFFLLGMPKNDVKTFTDTLSTYRHKIRYCQTCFNITFDQAVCNICSDEKRLTSTLCVVSEPKDLFALERTQAYHGKYHVLGGVLSPIDGIHPEILRIKELLARLNTEPITEIILALNPTIEGDATVHYLCNIFDKNSLTISKLAHGLPIGGQIDYADDLTLKKAFQGRNTVG